MKRVLGIIISIVIIGLGLSGQFVLKGTNSSTALVIAGVVFLIIEIIAAVIESKRDEQKEAQRARAISDAQLCSELGQTDTEEHQALTNNENDSEHNSLIVRLTDDNYYETIADNTHVVVCFCDLINGPSKIMLPMLFEFASDYKGNIVVGLYDVYAEGCEQVRADNDITAIPTLLFYKNGMEIQKNIGMVKKNMLKTLFDELLI